MTKFVLKIIAILLITENSYKRAFSRSGNQLTVLKAPEPRTICPGVLTWKQYNTH